MAFPAVELARYRRIPPEGCRCAGPGGLEPPSAVLETAALPLSYVPSGISGMPKRNRPPGHHPGGGACCCGLIRLHSGHRAPGHAQRQLARRGALRPALNGRRPGFHWAVPLRGCCLHHRRRYAQHRRHTNLFPPLTPITCRIVTTSSPPGRAGEAARLSRQRRLMSRLPRRRSA